MTERIISLLVALSLLFGGSGGYESGYVYEDPFAAERTEIVFSDMEYTRYNESDEFREAAERMKHLCSQENAFEEISSVYEWLYGEMLEIDTLYTLADIRCCIDAQNVQISEELDHIQAVWADLSVVFSDAVGSALSSQYGDVFSLLIGPYFTAMYGYVDTEADERLNELFLAESGLCEEYTELAAEEYTVLFEGQQWNEYDLYYSDDLSDEDYYLLYDQLMKKKNEALGPVYLKLVEVRQEMAELCGYEDYAGYCYDAVYGRSYTPEEIKAVQESVRACAAPVYWDIYENCYYDRNAPEVSYEDVIPALQKHIPDISAEMAEMLDYMIEHEMYYLADDLERSVDAGFTVTLNQYGQPFVYNAFYDDEYDDFYGVTDMVHEFGHYCDAFLNAPYGVNAPAGDYDLAEVLSCGLEMLFYEYYDEIFGGAADEARALLLEHAMYSLVESCMYDEAQQRVYALENPTLDQINGIYRETAVAYGFAWEGDVWYDWVDSSYLFEKPFYDMSYAAAYSAALEIWLTAQNEGHEAAKRMYLELLDIGSYGVYYADVISSCGMQGIQSAELIEEVSDTVLREMRELTGKGWQKLD